MKAFLAVIIVIGFFAVIAGLFFTRGIEDSVKDLLMVTLGVLLASFKEVISFFFGSSAGSAAKSAAIEQSLRSAEAKPLGTEPVSVKVDTTDAPVAVKDAGVE